MPLMSMREYARHSGVSLKAIQVRIKSGSITKAAIVDDGGRFPKLDSEIADADFAHRHDVQQKMFGDLGGATKSAKRPEPAIEPPAKVDDNPENLPDKAPEPPKPAAKKVVADVLPDTKPPEIPKAKVEEREINGQKVDATILPTLPEDKFDRYRDAKTSTEELRARKLELEVAEAEGRLLDADEVRKEVVKLVGETREAFLNLGPKLAPILVSITDPVEMENKLIESINETLHNLSRFEDGIG